MESQLQEEFLKECWLRLIKPPTMQPGQLEPFLKDFIKYMNKKRKELSETDQLFIGDDIMHLEKIVKRWEKSHPNNSSDHALRDLSAINYDIAKCKNVQGPLEGGKKYEFLVSYSNLLIDYLSSDAFTEIERYRWVQQNFFCYFNVPRDLFNKWLNSSIGKMK